MARIYEPQISIPTVGATRVEAPRTGDAITEGASRLYGAYQEMQRREAAADTALTVAQMRSKYLNRLKEDKRTGNITDNYTPNVLNEFDDELNSAIEGTNNSFTRQGLQLALTELRGSVEDTALNFEGEFRTLRKLSTIDKVAETDLADIGADTSFEEVMNRAVEYRALVDSQGLPEELRIKYDEQHRRYGDQFANVIAEYRPQELVAMLDDKKHPLRRLITPERLPVFLNKAQAKIAENERKALADSAVARAYTEVDGRRAVADAVVRLEAGKPLEPDIVDRVNAWKAVEPKSAPLIDAEISDAMAVGEGVAGIEALPNAELDAMAKRLSENEGASAVDKRRASVHLPAIAEIRKLRDKDPQGAAIAQAPSVAAAWEAATASGDPKAVAAAIDLGVAQQELWGITGKRQQRLLPLSVAKAEAAPLVDARGADIVERIDALRAKYGTRFPLVFSELMLAEDKLPRAIGTIASMSDLKSRQFVANALQTKAEDYNVDKARGDNVLALIQQNQTFKDISQSITTSGGAKAAAGLREAVEATALRLAAGGGLDVPSAVKKAVDMVISRDYQTRTIGSVPLRIPTNFNADKVEYTLKEIRRNYGLSERAPWGEMFRSPQRKGGAVGASPGDTADQTLRRSIGVRLNGYWVLDEDGDEPLVRLEHEAGPEKAPDGGDIVFRLRDVEAAGLTWSFGDFGREFKPPPLYRPKPVGAVTPPRATEFKTAPQGAGAPEPTAPRVSAQPTGTAPPPPSMSQQLRDKGKNKDARDLFNYNKGAD